MFNLLLAFGLKATSAEPKEEPPGRRILKQAMQKSYSPTGFEPAETRQQSCVIMHLQVFLSRFSLLINNHEGKYIAQNQNKKSEFEAQCSEHQKSLT